MPRKIYKNNKVYTRPQYYRAYSDNTKIRPKISDSHRAYSNIVQGSKGSFQNYNEIFDSSISKNSSVDSDPLEKLFGSQCSLVHEQMMRVFNEGETKEGTWASNALLSGRRLRFFEGL